MVLRQSRSEPFVPFQRMASTARILNSDGDPADGGTKGFTNRPLALPGDSLIHTDMDRDFLGDYAGCI